MSFENTTSTANKVLQLLADGECHSGQQLGAMLKITRSAIWKIIHEIKSRYSIPVESVAGKGYRIIGGLNLLHQKTLVNFVEQENFTALNQFILLNSIDSTNNYLEQFIVKGNKTRIACFAEQQTQGKGRRGRTWISPYGHNIYHSLLWSFNKDPGEILGLSIAIGVAVAKTLKNYGVDTGLGLKWPNDIYYENKKLGGVLIEFRASAHDCCYVIIGVGINTHLSEETINSIEQPCTTLKQILNKNVDRNRLAGLLLNELIMTLNEFDQQGLQPFLPRWQELDILQNKSVSLQLQNQQITGIMRGISPRGELLLARNEKIENYLSGEVSVRLV